MYFDYNYLIYIIYYKIYVNILFNFQLYFLYFVLIMDKEEKN